MSQMHLNPMKVALLQLVSHANFPVDDLPLLDPVIARCFPELHAKLAALAPDDVRGKIGQILSYVSAIEQINAGRVEIDRDLLELCDLPTVVPRGHPTLFATHPSAAVRTAFYQYAVGKKLPITKFLDELVFFGLFDPAVSQLALELFLSQLPALPDGTLTARHVAHIQCIKIQEGAAIFKEIERLIENTDDVAFACAWVRFLYHKDGWIREVAKEVLKQVFQFNAYIDVTKQPQSDYFAATFIKKLKNPGPVQPSALAESFFSTITSVDQPDYIKKISAARLAEVILDPFADVRTILPEIRELPFDAFPDLMHAAAIRDGSWRITDCQRLFDLVRSLNEENALHLLPVLSRAVFAPLTKIESDEANLLRLPIFVAERFDVRGGGGLYDSNVYAPTKAFPLAPLVEEWLKVSIQRRRPISEHFDIRLFVALAVSNKRLASDILTQIDEEETAAAKLALSAPPQLVLYLLLLSILTAKQPSVAAVRIANQLEAAHTLNALKVYQATLEAGGNCTLPGPIIDYVLDPQTRRAALSLLVTYAHFKKGLPEDLELDRLADLYQEPLPVNITRQLSALFLYQDRPELAVRYCEQKDALTQAFAFHRAPRDSQTASLALVCAANEKASVCTRGAAVELLAEFYRDNRVVSQNLAALYHTPTGETLLSLQLLRLLTVPDVRAQVSQANEFIVFFLAPERSELFVNAALYALYEVQFGGDIAIALTNLVAIEKYTNRVLQVIGLAPDRSLRYFHSDVFTAICSTFLHCNLNLSMTAMNHLMLVGIIFPVSSMSDLLSLYETYIDAGCCSSGVHGVLRQIFAASLDAKIGALERGFPLMALRELHCASENEAYFDRILLVCAQFVDGFPEGQRAIFEQWSLETLIGIFHPLGETLPFFLALSARNPDVQGLFAVEINSESLLSKIIDSIEEGKYLTAILIQLLAGLMNSESVRRAVYRTRKLTGLVSKLTYTVAKKEWSLADALLRVFATLTFYADGLDELLKVTNVPDLIELLSENPQAWESSFTEIFLRNLTSHARIWCGLAGAVNKASRSLLEKLKVRVGES
jgi:hypothetical protein